MTHGGRGMTLRLPGSPSSAGMARAFVRGAAESWSTDAEAVNDLTWLTSEVVTNAVLHATGGVELRVDRTGARVRVEVDDRSPNLPHHRFYGPESVTGRGLEVVDALATSWGARRLPNGKTVWFETGGQPEDSSTEGQDLDAPTAEGGAEMRRLTIRGIPVQVYLAAQEHGDALLREFSLIAESGARDTDVPSRLVEMARVARVAFAGPEADRRSQIDVAVLRGQEVMDLEFSVPLIAEPFTEDLWALLDEADEYCRSGDLLTLAATAEVKRFRVWFFEQVLAQFRREPGPPWAPTTNPD